jgi:outer membrane protein OmpA-like peptidoglycan-associated protein
MRESEAARADRERQARIALVNVAKAESLAIKDEPRGTVITVKVPFKTGKSDLPPKAAEQLAPVADALKLTKDREILVEGHTDSQGSADKNLDLSQKRAETVRDYLISRQVPANEVSATGVGETQPQDDNATAEGRANNRVVQIVVKKKPGESE